MPRDVSGDDSGSGSGRRHDLQGGLPGCSVVGVAGARGVVGSVEHHAGADGPPSQQPLIPDRHARTQSAGGGEW